MCVFIYFHVDCSFMSVWKNLQSRKDLRKRLEVRSTLGRQSLTCLCISIAPPSGQCVEWDVNEWPILEGS